MLLPPWDTHATLDRLATLLRRWSPETVVALGDSFHDTHGSGRLPATELNRLNVMTQAHRFVWVRGNHDPAPPAGIGGESVAYFACGPISFRHEALASAHDAEVVGHHHPKAQVQARSGTVSRPCFMSDGRRLMMPAFGAYTGGLDVCDPAIMRLFPRGGRVFLLGKDRLFSFEIGRGRALRVG
jgi:DNA ligase-associated metallophosphoesterase